jgi:fluoroquinolone transport system permease protein
VTTSSVPTTRATQLKALAPALFRAVHWQPVVVSAAASALLLWWQWGATAQPAKALWLLRAVALLLAVGIAFALDDRTRPTLAAVPTPLRWRASVRLICVAPPAALAWCAALVLVEWRADGTVAGWALTLEAVAFGAVVLALAGGLARWRDVTDPGTVVGPAILGLGLLVPQLPDKIALVGLPGPGWGPAHLRWTSLFAIAVAVLALSLRDPAAARRKLLG